MTRNVTTSFMRSSEARFSDEVDLIFLRIVHPSITTIRVVNDTTDYLLDTGTGLNTYIGFPFDIEILSDDESPPSAKLTIQNVDPRIGDSVRSLLKPPTLSIGLYSSADWDLTVTPRTPIGAPTLIYGAGSLFLTNITVDIIQITGTIVGWDYLQRVWPAERASEANFPALFRS
jgi:hypothetical protein